MILLNISCFLANNSISFLGSLPELKMKIKGFIGLESSNTVAKSKGGNSNKLN